MSWPVAESRSRPLTTPRKRTPRVVWVLVVSAFLCGGLLSAAGFSVGWRHEAQKGSSAESALASATARTHALSAQLAATRTALAAAHGHTASLASARTGLAHANAALRKSLAAATRARAQVSSAASPLAGELDRVTSELHALSGYLTSTPSSQLDAGYVQAQVAYLTKTVDGLRSGVGALAAQAAPGHR